MRSARNRKKTQRNRLLLIPFIIIGLLFGAEYLFHDTTFNDADTNNVERNDESNDEQSNEEPSNEEQSNEEPDPVPDEDTFTDIRIAATGDIMFHGPQLKSAYHSQQDTYDFKSVFDDVKPILSDADLTIGNYETTAAGSDKPYTGYPTFNSPDETFDALIHAGFDVLTTANNHSLDTGSSGLKRTVKIIREKGLQSTGTYEEKPDSRILWQEVKGIKIAILAYTESTNGLGSQYPDAELHAMINLMEKENIIADINEAKEKDADLIITAMHWGNEYEETPNEKQIEFAEMMAAEGVDIILGNHPHVIQKSEFLEVNDNEAFVVYSMGNFISNQRLETLGDNRENTENGVIVHIDVRQNDRTKETTIQNIEYVPTWVYRDKASGESTYTYRILPVEEFVDSKDIPDNFKKRMEQSFESTVSKMDATPKSKQ